MTSMNRCPHPRCESRKPSHVYACRHHWEKLPRKIRLRIWEGYEKSKELWLLADAEAKAFWRANP